MDTRGTKIINAGRAFARKVLLYLLGHEKGAGAVGASYAQRTGSTRSGLTILQGLRTEALPLSEDSLSELRDEGE